MKAIRLIIIFAWLMSAGLASPLAAADGSTEFRAFADGLAQRHGLDSQQVMDWLTRSQHRQAIIDDISSPAESLPWHRYRGIFLKSGRIQDGVAFWNNHRKLLERAQARYGVPPRLIVAILGVETRYGEYSGGYRVLDALRTLAFDYPPREDFFRSELEAYLVLTNEQGIDPLEPKGSYAGAMGMPQFIASSYQAYAIDFNDNGRTDLWNETADAVGSVANYLAEHGWAADAPVVTRASVSGNGWQDYDTDGLKPNTTVRELRAAGVTPQADYPDGRPARLLVLEGSDGPQYWVARRNFYVITRYNHSALYALAVHQLGQAINERREAD